MKAYRLEILVIDFDKVDSDEMVRLIEDIKYSNWCIIPKVMNVRCADIGPWHDAHPLNQESTMGAEYERLFNGPTDKRIDELETKVTRLKQHISNRMSEIYAAAAVPHPSIPLIPHLESLVACQTRLREIEDLLLNFHKWVTSQPSARTVKGKE